MGLQVGLLVLLILSQRHAPDLEEFDVLFEELVDELVDGCATLLSASGEEVEHFGVESHGRDESQVGLIEFAALSV